MVKVDGKSGNEGGDDKKPDLRSVYDSLAERFSLPDFSSLDEEFDVSSLDAERFSLKSLLRHLVDKFDSKSSFLESLIQPDTTLISLHEAQFLSVDDRRLALSLLRSLMKVLRLAQRELLFGSDDSRAEAVNSLWSFWLDKKSSFRRLLSSVVSAWDNDISVVDNERYFG